MLSSLCILSVAYIKTLWRARWFKVPGLPLSESANIAFSDVKSKPFSQKLKKNHWSYGLRTENWDLFNETTKKYGGEDCLWLGMLNADVAGSCQGFADLKALCSRSKIIFSDHQSREVISGFEQNSLNGMLFKLASNEDRRGG